MFLTKQDIEDSFSVLKAYENLNSEDQVKILVATDIAKSMFPEFETLKAEEKADLINMLIEDMSIDFYKIN